MKNKAYVNLGGVAMGIAGSFCDAELFQKYFGHARRMGGHDGDRAPHHAGDLRCGGIRTGAWPG